MYHLETGFECEGCAAYVAQDTDATFPFCMSCQIKEHDLCGNCKLATATEMGLCQACDEQAERAWMEANKDRCTDCFQRKASDESGLCKGCLTARANESSF